MEEQVMAPLMGRGSVAIGKRSQVGPSYITGYLWACLKETVNLHSQFGSPWVLSVYFQAPG